MSSEIDYSTPAAHRPAGSDQRARTTPVAATWDYIAFEGPADFHTLTEQYDLTSMGVTGMVPVATPFAWTAAAEPTTHLILATERNPPTGARRIGDDRGWIAPTDPDGCELGRVYLAGPRYAVEAVSQTLRATAETTHGPARPLTSSNTGTTSGVKR
jgi:hypothetical protein